VSFGPYIPELGGQAPPGITVEHVLEAEQQQRQVQPTPLYWAARDAVEVIGVLKEKKKAYFEFARTRGFIDAWLASYCQRHGQAVDDVQSWETLSVGFAGDDGELLNFRVNEVASYADQLVTMAIGNRPAFETYATNDNYDSLAQAEPSDRIVEYVYADRYGERKERRVIDHAAWYAQGYTWMRWDPTAGEQLPAKEVTVMRTLPDGSQAPELDPKTGRPVTEMVPGPKTGHIILKALYPWDQYCEPRTEDPDDHLWRTAIERRSRHELAGLFPELAAQLLAVDGNDPYSIESLFSTDPVSSNAQRDEIPVEHFYHLPSPALDAAQGGKFKTGRYLCFAGDIKLLDIPLAYPTIPLIEFKPWPWDGCAFGYTPIYDMLSINTVIDQLMSDGASNLTNWGRLSMVMDVGTTITAEELARGERIFTKPTDTDHPKYIDPPAIPESAKWFLEQCIKRLQSRSGLNAVTRGDPDKNITSGTMAALFHSIAIEANSGLQAAVDQHREAVANMILVVLQRFAEHPMIFGIAGGDDRDYVASFTKSDLEGVRGVRVKTANPMSRTQAGRMEVAQLMLKIPGAIEDPAQLNETLNSGTPTPLYKNARLRRLRIKYENELLRGDPKKGPPQVQQKVDPPPPELPNGMPSGPAPIPYRWVPAVPVLMTDIHPLHIESHTAELSTKRALEDPAYADAVMAHIEHHMHMWKSTAPDYLQAFHCPPYPGSMAAPAPGAPGLPPGGGGPGGPPHPAPGGGGGGGAHMPEALQHKQGPDVGTPIPKPAQSPIGTPQAA
jgi:hypothetical protein